MNGAVLLPAVLQALIIPLSRAVASFGATSPADPQGRSLGMLALSFLGLQPQLVSLVQPGDLDWGPSLRGSRKPGSDNQSLSVPLGQGEGRVVYIRNLASDMSSRELKRRFEVFGEVVECQVLTRSTR